MFPLYKWGMFPLYLIEKNRSIPEKQAAQTVYNLRRKKMGSRTLNVFGSSISERPEITPICMEEGRWRGDTVVESRMVRNLWDLYAGERGGNLPCLQERPGCVTEQSWTP